MALLSPTFAHSTRSPRTKTKFAVLPLPLTLMLLAVISVSIRVIPCYKAAFNYSTTGSITGVLHTSSLGIK